MLLHEDVSEFNSISTDFALLGSGPFPLTVFLQTPHVEPTLHFPRKLLSQLV